MAGKASRGTPVGRDTLVEYLDGYLDAQSGSDYCPNGLQVEGRREIGKLITGVSACEALFQQAADREADAVLVHHGLFWRGDSGALTGVQYRRVASLIRQEINLLAYHLPLDRHLEVGNNAVLAQRIGLANLHPFCTYEGQSIGVSGRFANERPTFDSLVAQLAEHFGQAPLAFASGPGAITTVAIVSGAGGRCLHQAIGQQFDLFITGEAEEWTMNLVREAGINFIAGGHHATERFGVQALGSHLQDRFGLEVEFIDIANPV